MIAAMKVAMRTNWGEGAGTAPTGGGGALARALRQSRGERSIRSVASDAGISQTHLSRIESGERTAPPDLVVRLAAAMQVDAEPLLELTADLSAGVLRQLAEPEFRLALRGDELAASTRSLLRRAHLREVAERVRARIGGEARDPVDVRQLVAAVGATLKPSTAAAPSVVVEPEPGIAVSPNGVTQKRYRFLVAHAVGHVALGATAGCDIDGAADEELDATALASFLLVPAAALRNFARNEGRRHDMWDPDGAEFVAAAASRFAVPLWMVARRLGEDGRLAELGGVDER